MSSGTTSGPRLLVITGAAGRIGTFYRKWLHDAGRVGDGADQWRLRLVDVREPADVASGDEVIAGEKEADLADLEVARQTSAGAHTVLHLAADPSPRADFYGSLLDKNIKAPYNVLQACIETGAKRCILASSINAVNGYPKSRQVRASDVPFPGNIYGASKAWSEALAGAFVSLHPGFSAIAIRIGGVNSYERMRERAQRPPAEITAEDGRSIVVTLPDLSRLFDRCLAAGPEVTFAVVTGVSKNRILRMDLEETQQLVGYAPEDDAFDDWSQR